MSNWLGLKIGLCICFVKYRAAFASEAKPKDRDPYHLSRRCPRVSQINLNLFISRRLGVKSASGFR